MLHASTFVFLVHIPYTSQPENPPSLDISVFLQLWLMQWSLNQKEEDLEQIMKATIQSLTVKLRAMMNCKWFKRS